MATKTKRKSTRKSAPKKRRSRSRRNPAAVMSSQAVETTKQAGAIILGSAVADTAVNIINANVLASQGRAVRSGVAIAAPAVAGIALMSQAKGRAAQNVGLGMAIVGVKNGIAATIHAVTGAGRSLAGSRGLGCGSCVQPQPAVQILPAPPPRPTLQLAAHAGGSQLPAGSRIAVAA